MLLDILFYDYNFFLTRHKKHPSASVNPTNQLGSETKGLISTLGLCIGTTLVNCSFNCSLKSLFIEAFMLIIFSKPSFVRCSPLLS